MNLRTVRATDSVKISVILLIAIFHYFSVFLYFLIRYAPSFFPCRSLYSSSGQFLKNVTALPFLSLQWRHNYISTVTVRTTNKLTNQQLTHIAGYLVFKQVLQLMLTVEIQYSVTAECSEHGQMFSQRCARHVTPCRWVSGFRRFGRNVSIIKRSQ
jgi:hypothetical protein